MMSHFRPHGKIIALLTSFGIIYPLMIIAFNKKMKKELAEKVGKFLKEIKNCFSRHVRVSPS
jgi:hypothetical protein